MLNISTNWKNIIEEYNNNNNNNNYKKQYTTFLNEVNKLYDNSYNIIYPKLSLVFYCFNFFNHQTTKVVILGQDPYYTPNYANGLCFGTNNIKIPPSLKNITKELKNDLNIDLNDISLEHWAKQGILLLNASLTVLEKKPSSHMKFWRDFTNYIISYLNNLNKPIIFVAWGNFAYQQLKNINLNKHFLIISSHPSPLSCYKKFNDYPAFLNSKPFSKINNILKNLNQNIIDW